MTSHCSSVLRHRWTGVRMGGILVVLPVGWCIPVSDLRTSCVINRRRYGGYVGRYQVG